MTIWAECFDLSDRAESAAEALVTTETVDTVWDVTEDPVSSATRAAWATCRDAVDRALGRSQ